MSQAVIYQVSGGDKCLINDARQAMLYPFTAPSWTDLRIGFFLSLCKSTDNGDITGLAETLTTTGVAADRFWIGLKSNNTTMPLASGVPWIGWTNTVVPTEAATSSILASSDTGTGTTNTNFWRVSTPATYGAVFDGTTFREGFSDYEATTNALHWPQNAANAGGNAALSILRLTRAPAATSIITSFNKQATTPIYSSTPTIALIRSYLRALPAMGSKGSTDTLAAVPDALYFYWPFYNSKLRIHSLCVEKFA